MTLLNIKKLIFIFNFLLRFQKYYDKAHKSYLSKFPLYIINPYDNPIMGSTYQLSLHIQNRFCHLHTNLYQNFNNDFIVIELILFFYIIIHDYQLINKLKVYQFLFQNIMAVTFKFMLSLLNLILKYIFFISINV